MKKWLSPLLALLVLAAAWWFYQSRQPRFGAGQKAADFTVSLANGTQAKLSDLRGKFVLLQFWGSWCGPCRAENPHLVELYHKYHDKGLEIFSIGLEQRVANWQAAIQRDKMEWPYHASALKEFEDPVAVLYNVKSIPTTFLINPDGNIVGVDLTPPMLDKMLNEQL